MWIIVAAAALLRDEGFIVKIFANLLASPGASAQKNPIRRHQSRRRETKLLWEF